MKTDSHLIRDLPDPKAASRFLDQLAEKHPSLHAKLLKNESLVSDVLTLASFSPLLATTLLQHPEYMWWLERKRRESGVRGKDELLESLARFALTNSLEPQILYARFRRRELLRIYLRDIRRLATIAEITEEISNLADAILESALENSHREMDNRYGSPQERDEKGRTSPAGFCIVALGKLGSRELNYSSDIDLLFLYSAEGNTTGTGSRGAVTNREYFVKLAEFTVKLVGHQTGEGAAYRVDLRLRPHGSLGSLTLSVRDTARYCKSEARPWELQVLIRSRGCAGDVELFKQFFRQVGSLVFSKSETVTSALANVRRSKEQIDLENINKRGFNVKLGQGGIREIEFLAQALQLAYGGKDRWLRSPHTLISLARLTDRKHLSESELTGLSAAYEFLRRTEHVLQMENGVQTHTVPEDHVKRSLLGARMAFASGGNFDNDLAIHTRNVKSVFARVFGEVTDSSQLEVTEVPNAADRVLSHVMASLEKSEIEFESTDENLAVLEKITAVSPHFSSMLAANPSLIGQLSDPEDSFTEPKYFEEMLEAVESERDFGARLSAMRRVWSRFLFEIVVRDIYETISIREAKSLQTKLAEATVSAALRVVRDEMSIRASRGGTIDDLVVLALGKMGGRGLDYDSDLDVVMVYYDSRMQEGVMAPSEFYSRAVELFATTLSSMTRDGNLYRVDLRLRPFGSKGMSAISIDAFIGYMHDTAAMWEMLAFVKLRAVGGERSLGLTVESETRRIIHERAANLPVQELASETKRVRIALEQQRAGARRTSEIDIKYGSGGMLDIYFAMRFLQLRDNVPDDSDDRTTTFMLEKLVESGSLTSQLHTAVVAGYEFLFTFDHNLRLTVGRTTRVPLANRSALQTIATRMKLTSSEELLENLSIHRLNVRNAFDQILG